MLRFENSLPKLPIPTLEETADRCLSSLKPLLSSAELASTAKAVQEFVALGSFGSKLQEKLISRAKERPSWLSEWCNETAYFTSRPAVVPYLSYFFGYHDDRIRRDPAKRAAAITTAALEFKNRIVEGTMEPFYWKGRPIAMNFYLWMFNATRIPARLTDYPLKYPFAGNQHLVAIRKNQFSKIPHEVDGNPLNTSELEQQFKYVYAMAERVPPVGALTSEHRDVWSDAREILIKAHSANAKALGDIGAASFVMCLDNASPVTLKERSLSYWHGDGANRWFDKPGQFIVNDNSTAGFIGEHIMMDGSPTHHLNHYVNDVIAHDKLDFSEAAVRSNLPDPTIIKFHITKKI